jgi:hypothetical protein
LIRDADAFCELIERFSDVDERLFDVTDVPLEQEEGTLGLGNGTVQRIRLDVFDNRVGT